MNASAYANVFSSSAADAVDRVLPRDAAATRARLENLARLMDSAVRIPGTNIRFGADAALGLVPVFGNLATTIVAGYLILEARRLGVSRFTLARMIANVGVDAAISAVPIVGNIADVFFKANRRNMALLRRCLDERA